ncbi:MAG: response regulator [Niabella sp.]
MSNKNSIYIIDDDPIFRLITRKLLEKRGDYANISFFENGQKGVNALGEQFSTNKEDAPGTIFLDIEMPVMNGWEFMDAFEKFPEELTKDIDVYIVSSSIADEDKQRASTYASIKDYFVKPLTIEILERIKPV